MKIGLVGYQGSGKSTLFEWLTSVTADPALAHTMQGASTPVPDPRIKPLCDIYHPKKITLASLEFVDTPGLSRDHEGNATKLGLLREAECLILIVPAWKGHDAQRDMVSFEEDLLLADMEIVSGRIDRLTESIKKPRPNREEEMAELEGLKPVLAAMEKGEPLQYDQMDEVQRKATRSFRLLTEKKRIIIINVADDEPDPQGLEKRIETPWPVVAVPGGLQLELSRMSQEDRDEFIQDMGLEIFNREELLHKILTASGQLLYFTAGEKEVRSWMLRSGGTALEAAANIHTDLARGFIRAETMHCDDLFRLGSEREMKANNLMRQEPKDYVIADGDIINIRFNV